MLLIAIYGRLVTRVGWFSSIDATGSELKALDCEEGKVFVVPITT